MSGEKQIKMREDWSESRDGRKLYMRSWQREAPKAHVLLVHGLAEHSGRYEHVAHAMVEAGFDVHALDLRGHGKSEGVRAHIRSFDEFLWDVEAVFHRLRSREETSQFYLLGHSMGGLVASTYVIRHNPELLGLILSAPALKAGDDIQPAMIALARAIGFVMPKFPLQKLDAQWISRDPEVVSDYNTDPLNYRGGVRAGLGAAMLKTFEEIDARNHEITLPLLILQGSEDKLVNPEGGKMLFEKVTSEEKDYKVYKGLYHEVFNEPEREQVLEDTISWLQTLHARISD
tara:strand:+ start:7265 stop:8128 length:864 start_codon:yes stop_codon:yes gene_type:complete